MTGPWRRWPCVLAASLLACGPSARQLRLRAGRAATLRLPGTWTVDYTCARPGSASDVLLVNDPDAPCRRALRSPRRVIWLGYLSLGELSTSLAIYPIAVREGLVREPNPRWPGARRLDVTRPAWRDAYLLPRAEDLASAGFQGAFLDTLDSALAVRGPGPADELRDAVVRGVYALRRRHPEWVLVPNGGLELRERLRSLVDAWALEDVFWGYDFVRRRYRPTDPERQAAVLPALRELRARGVPVYVLDYAPADDPGARDQARARCAAEGFHCAVQSIELP